MTGRLTFGRALVNGALSGAATGALIGYIFGLFSLITPLTSALVLAFYGLVFGAIVGAVIGAIGQALSGGRRDFSSVSGMQADHYNLMADDDVAAEAARLLETMGTGAAGVVRSTS